MFKYEKTEARLRIEERVQFEKKNDQKWRTAKDLVGIQNVSMKWCLTYLREQFMFLFKVIQAYFWINIA